MNDLIKLLWLIFTLWALFDIFQAHRNLGWKILWIIICLAFPVAGALVYYFFGRTDR